MEHGRHLENKKNCDVSVTVWILKSTMADDHHLENINRNISTMA